MLWEQEAKGKLQERGIVDEKMEVNFGLINNQSNNKQEGMSVVEVVEVVSFAAIFLLLARRFYQHCAFIARKMTRRQQAILREAVEIGTRAAPVSIAMPGLSTALAPPAMPPTFPPIYTQPVVTLPTRPSKGHTLPGYTDYGH